MACNGLKMGSFHLFRHPHGLGSFLEKHILDPFLSHFFVPKQPIFKAFCDFGGAKMACNALKMGSFDLLQYHFWKTTFLTHF